MKLSYEDLVSRAKNMFKEAEPAPRKKVQSIQ